MKQLLEMYNESSQQFEDFAFKHIIPPSLKLIEITLKLTMFYAFFLLVKNAINELF